MRSAPTLRTFAPPCVPSVPTGTCQPESETAGTPSEASAIAPRATLAVSPVASRASSSRSGGSSVSSRARASSASVVSPCALSTTTTSSPCFQVRRTILMARSSRSRSRTLLPPNFCTIRPIAAPFSTQQKNESANCKQSADSLYAVPSPRVQPARISNLTTPAVSAALAMSSSSDSRISLVSAEMVTAAQPFVGMLWLMVSICARGTGKNRKNVAPARPDYFP